jgi:anaerobic dimethyl sulfoxide reductase subunit A
LEKVRFPISCNLDCGGGCPLIATVENGVVTQIENSLLGAPGMTGCLKGLQMQRVLYAKDRLKRPLIRTGSRGSGDFREADWGEALDLVASKLVEIRERYGASSVLHLGGSGSTRACLHNTLRLTKRFLAFYGGYTERWSSYSIGAFQYTIPHTLGTLETGIDSATLDDSKLIILWGANIQDNKYECGLEARLHEAKRRGVEILVIDPRRTSTVKSLATQWIPILPGSDTALMMAILYVLLVKGLVDRGFVEKVSYGFGKLEDFVLGRVDGVERTPEWAESICGISATKIIEFAVKYGSTHPSALIPGNSIQRVIGGEEAMRMGVALQVATGNFGISGGSSGTLAFGTLPKPRVGIIGFPQNPAKVSIPVYRWADAILEGKTGGFPTDIKAVYNVGGNYVNEGSDTKKAIRAYESVEFSVCHDRFLTETAKHSDVVLPATTFLERNDIVTPNSGNYLLFSNKVADPVGESRNDYDIFCGLSKRLGFFKEFSRERDEEAWLRFFASESDVGDFEEFRKAGIRFIGTQRRIAFSDFVSDPARYPLATPSGKVQIFSEAYARLGASPVPDVRVMASSAMYPLRLISPKAANRVHSQNANIPWFSDREPHRLWINPIDASLRGIRDGEMVSVTSPQGETKVGAWVTDDIMVGVVCLHEGVWPNIDENGVDHSGSVNILTSTTPTQPSQASRTHSVAVQVGK